MYSYHDRVSYSRIDKDGLLGVSDTVNAMQDSLPVSQRGRRTFCLRFIKEKPRLVSERVARCIQTPSGYGRAFHGAYMAVSV